MNKLENPKQKADKSEETEQEDHKVRDAEMVIAPKNAPTRRHVASGQAIFDKRGQKIGAVVGMRDVTGQRVAEEKLRKSEEQSNCRERRGHNLPHRCPWTIYLCQ